ncbi:MAG: hypothetical protein M3Z21_08940, partial [Pseudomonadota bacterium]|nr:hypothetical protein [Pseudomonadota bacterium]
VILALLLVAGGWLWWQRRKILRRARQAQADVIEAEYQVLEVRREPPAAGQRPETPARRRPLD